MYCLQLDELNDVIKQKQPELANQKGIVFHHDNARPCTKYQMVSQFDFDYSQFELEKV